MSTEGGGVTTTVVSLQDMGQDGGGGPTTVSENALLVDKKHRVSLQTAIKLRLAVLILSWFSVVYLSIMGVTVFVMAITKDNTAAFAFALDALLDCLSSAVVIWRYSGAAATLYSCRRERVACITLGALFLVSFLVIVVKTIVTLIDNTPSERSEILFCLSAVNVVVCFLLMVGKSVIASKLESVSIATDAVNSGIGFALALASVIGDVLTDVYPSVWCIDPVVGLACSVFLLIYGIWIIVYEVRLSAQDAKAVSLESSTSQ